MADQLHYSIRDFRDILLAELTKLEFGAREHHVNTSAVASVRSASLQVPVQAPVQVQEHNHEHERENKKLRKEIAELTEQIKTHEKNSKNSTIVSDLESTVESLNRQLKKVEQDNLALQHAVKSASNEALAKDAKIHELGAELAAERVTVLKLQLELKGAMVQVPVQAPVQVQVPVQAPAPLKTVTHPLLGKIQEPVAVEAKEKEEVEADEESEEGIDPSSLPNFKHKGVTYKRDTDNTLYSETEEGWEIVGTWDEKTKSIVVETASVEDEAEAEAEEEDPELTEFIFKGKTYYLDEENAVFQSTDEGYEQVGTWNGKKILFE